MALAETLAPPPADDDPDVEAVAGLILGFENLDARVLGGEWIVVGVDRQGVHLLIRTAPGQVARYTGRQLRLAIRTLEADPPWPARVTAAVVRLLEHKLRLVHEIGGTA